MSAAWSCGQVGTPVIGSDAFQETPIVEVSRAITKHHYLVQKTEDDLLAITNFGQKSLDEVLQKLDERGLSLRVKD